MISIWDSFLLPPVVSAFVSVQGKNWQRVLGVSTEVTEMSWLGVIDRAE